MVVPSPNINSSRDIGLFEFIDHEHFSSEETQLLQSTLWALKRPMTSAASGWLWIYKVGLLDEASRTNFGCAKRVSSESSGA